MDKLNKAILTIGFFLIALFLVLAAILVLVNRTGRKEVTEEITSTVVLEKITDQYFVVSKTVLIDQETEIKIDEGSRWSNFLWGQTITAEAMIRVDVGVDLSKLTTEDIKINDETKTVQITIPQASILDASQYGDIDVNSKKGVLKFLLDNDPNEDHNQALETLLKEAEKAIIDDQELLDEARRDSVKVIGLIVTNLSYDLVVN